MRSYLLRNASVASPQFPTFVSSIYRFLEQNIFSSQTHSLHLYLSIASILKIHRRFHHQSHQNARFHFLLPRSPSIPLDPRSKLGGSTRVCCKSYPRIFCQLLNSRSNIHPKQPAATSGIASTGCSIADFKCICSATAFITSLQTAVEAHCNQADQQRTFHSTISHTFLSNDAYKANERT